MANMEETLVLVKPDGVKKHICGEVIARLNAKGFLLKRLR